MKYMGSKARIAKDLLPIILKDRLERQYYVEPFCGGCNIMDKVDGNRIANDSNSYLISMWKSLTTGWKPPLIIERDFYNEVRNCYNTKNGLFNDDLIVTMGFTTAAFIRRNTSELRKKLKELGYKNYGNPFQITDDSKLITTIDGEYVPYNVPLDDSFIDCGTNEELFLAIAALRDDTDENQWFVTDSPLSVSYDDAVGNDHYFTEPKGSVFFWDINWMHATIISGNYHKATVEELIEHFKEKEE